MNTLENINFSKKTPSKIDLADKNPDFNALFSWLENKRDIKLWEKEAEKKWNAEFMELSWKCMRKFEWFDGRDLTMGCAYVKEWTIGVLGKITGANLERAQDILSRFLEIEEAAK